MCCRNPSKSRTRGEHAQRRSWAFWFAHSSSIQLKNVSRQARYPPPIGGGGASADAAVVALRAAKGTRTGATRAARLAVVAGRLWTGVRAGTAVRAAVAVRAGTAAARAGTTWGMAARDWVWGIAARDCVALPPSPGLRGTGRPVAVSACLVTTARGWGTALRPEGPTAPRVGWTFVGAAADGAARCSPRPPDAAGASPVGPRGAGRAVADRAASKSTESGRGETSAYAKPYATKTSAKNDNSLLISYGNI